MMILVLLLGQVCSVISFGLVPRMRRRLFHRRYPATVFFNKSDLTIRNMDDFTTTTTRAAAAAADDDFGMNKNISNRRGFLKEQISSSIMMGSSLGLVLPKRASAIEETVLPAPNQNIATGLTSSSSSSKKPFAPIENLLPAVRVKQSIDRAIILTKSLVPDADGGGTSSSSKLLIDLDTIQELEALLIQPQNYTQSLKLQGVPPKPANLYLDSYKPMKGDLPLQRLLIQNGDVQTWKQLKKAEKNQEKTSEVRAALNAYTDALSFSGDSYLLNVDRATRSNMVREDRLPDVKQVITSDMGMRYLFRNQVLTAMDDVKAEFEYQLVQIDRYLKGDNHAISGSAETNIVDLVDAGTDFKELLDLLIISEKAMDRWLSLIDANDVRDAVGLCQREK